MLGIIMRLSMLVDRCSTNSESTIISEALRNTVNSHFQPSSKFDYFTQDLHETI